MLLTLRRPSTQRGRPMLCHPHFASITRSGRRAADVARMGQSLHASFFFFLFGYVCRHRQLAGRHASTWLPVDYPRQRSAQRRRLTTRNAGYVRPVVPDSLLSQTDKIDKPFASLWRKQVSASFTAARLAVIFFFVDFFSGSSLGRLDSRFHGDTRDSLPAILTRRT